jgi:hypothetical protein
MKLVAEEFGETLGYDKALKIVRKYSGRERSSLQGLHPQSKRPTKKIINPTKVRFLGTRALGKHLKKALATLNLAQMTWYMASRHSFATHFIVAGGSQDRLKDILGHSSLQTTERYVHAARSFDGEKERTIFRVSIGTIQEEISSGSIGIIDRNSLKDIPPPPEVDWDNEEVA